MGARGPAPTHPAILRLRGSDRAERRGPVPEGDGKKPSCPSWLKPDGRKLFRSLARQLHGMGVLERVDAGALARYSRLFVRWLKLEEFIEENGQTYVRRGKPTEKEPKGPIVEVKLWPQAREARNLSEKLLQLEREFGLTPGGRTRLAGLLSDDDEHQGERGGTAGYLTG